MSKMLQKDPISHEDVETLGGRITRAREALDMSTAQLARRAGLRTDTLAKWESDASEPRTNRLVTLAGMLNVSPTWLLMGSGSGPDDMISGDELEILQRELIKAREAASGLLSMVENIEQRLARINNPAFKDE